LFEGFLMLLLEEEEEERCRGGGWSFRRLLRLQLGVMVVMDAIEDRWVYVCMYSLYVCIDGAWDWLWWFVRRAME